MSNARLVSIAQKAGAVPKEPTGSPDSAHLRVFLKLMSHVKRVDLEKGITLNELRVRCREKFGGYDELPPVHAIQFFTSDQSSKTLFEVESMADVYSGCVLEIRNAGGLQPASAEQVQQLKILEQQLRAAHSQIAQLQLALSERDEAVLTAQTESQRKADDVVASRRQQLAQENQNSQLRQRIIDLQAQLDSSEQAVAQNLMLHTENDKLKVNNAELLTDNTRLRRDYDFINTQYTALLRNITAGSTSVPSAAALSALGASVVPSSTQVASSPLSHQQHQQQQQQQQQSPQQLPLDSSTPSPPSAKSRTSDLPMSLQIALGKNLVPGELQAMQQLPVQAMAQLQVLSNAGRKHADTEQQHQQQQQQQQLRDDSANLSTNTSSDYSASSDHVGSRSSSYQSRNSSTGGAFHAPFRPSLFPHQKFDAQRQSAQPRNSFSRGGSAVPAAMPIHLTDHDPYDSPHSVSAQRRVDEWLRLYERPLFDQLSTVATTGYDRCMVMLFPIESVAPNISDVARSNRVTNPTTDGNSGFVTFKLLVDSDDDIELWEEIEVSRLLEERFKQRGFRYVRYDRVFSSCVITFEW
eukprot:TRINITY_DN2693_c0_g7_i2.p1 TRINITY_DN2693_c0_g7~~TRINITY_DN2693_c0_g7_i2.p1  ORF type:complete len:597 (+),score=144.22 TRINITY_DN2693_c0_g7_i2:51-1793(+)